MLQCICNNNVIFMLLIFLSRVKMNSTNWPAPNVWVFMAQMVEHCSPNAEALGSNPVEVTEWLWGREWLKSRKNFRVYLQLPKLQLPLRRSHLHLK